MQTEGSLPVHLHTLCLIQSFTGSDEGRTRGCTGFRHRPQRRAKQEMLLLQMVALVLCKGRFTNLTSSMGHAVFDTPCPILSLPRKLFIRLHSVAARSRGCGLHKAPAAGTLSKLSCQSCEAYRLLGAQAANVPHQKSSAEVCCTLQVPIMEQDYVMVDNLANGNINEASAAAAALDKNILDPAVAATAPKPASSASLSIMTIDSDDDLVMESDAQALAERTQQQQLKAPPVQVQLNARPATATGMAAPKTPEVPTGTVELVDLTEPAGPSSAPNLRKRSSSLRSDDVYAALYESEDDEELQMQTQPAARKQPRAAPAPLPKPRVVCLELRYPDHWDIEDMDSKSSARLFDLPLDPKENRAWLLPTLSIRAAAAGVKEADVTVLQEFGIDEHDARAGLLLANKNVDDALALAVSYMESGGVVAEWARQAGLEDDVKKSLMCVEAEEVIQKMEATGVARARVIKVQRVQHMKKWMDYCYFKQSLEDPNEKQLFHGSGAVVIDQIVREGFDPRLAASTGSYGAGTYFADTASTSLGYCQKGMPLALTSVAPAYTFTSTNTWIGPAGSGVQMTSNGNGQFWAPAAAAGPVGTGASAQTTPPNWKMIVARVALGKQSPGRSGMRRPPDGFHSVTGSGCHVIFDNNQAYPEYVITVRPFM